MNCTKCLLVFTAALLLTGVLHAEPSLECSATIDWLGSLEAEIAPLVSGGQVPVTDIVILTEELDPGTYSLLVWTDLSVEVLNISGMDAVSRRVLVFDEVDIPGEMIESAGDMEVFAWRLALYDPIEVQVELSVGAAYWPGVEGFTELVFEGQSDGFVYAIFQGEMDEVGRQIFSGSNAPPPCE